MKQLLIAIVLILFIVISRWVAAVVIIGGQIESVTPESTELASESFSVDGSLDAYANWVVGFDCTDPQVTAGILQPNSVATTSCARFTGVTWPNDQYGQITVITANTDAEKKLCTTLRHQSGTFEFYRVCARGPLGPSATLELRKQTNAGGLQVIYSATQTINNGDVVRGEVVGTTFTLKINGSTITTQTDSSLSTGFVGVLIAADTGAVTDSQLDAWSGGSIP